MAQKVEVEEHDHLFRVAFFRAAEPADAVVKVTFGQPAGIAGIFVVRRIACEQLREPRGITLVRGVHQGIESDFHNLRLSEKKLLNW